MRDFAAGKLEEPLSTRIEAHVQSCAACQAWLKDYESGAGRSQGQTPLTASAGELTEMVIPTEQFREGDEKIRTAVGGSFDFTLLEKSPRADALGRFGPYDLLQAVGYGGMGIVFRGFEESLNRTVAIKVLARQLASSPEARVRFHREAKAAAAINHPNVVTIHAVSEHAGIPFLVMEYVKGQSLHERIRATAPMDVLDILRIASQAASGLGAAHKRGVIHRDIKPANIMLENGVERVKITDFGLARVTREVSELSSAGFVLGTPSHMSPEQVSGKTLDARSDLFSLGCVIYGMVAGKSPFQGSHSIEVQKKVLEYDPPALHELDPEIPRPLSDIVSRLLAKEPDARYQTAAEVAGLLTNLLSQVEQGHSAQLQTPTDPASSAPPRPSGRVRLWSFGAVFVIALVLFAVWSGWGREPSPAAPPNESPTVESEAMEERLEPLRGEITISKDGNAQFRSITEALGRAGPGATLRILDSGEYFEAIFINDARRLTGVTLEAAGERPRLRCAALSGPVITVENTPNVTIRGLEIRASAGHCGVGVAGQVPGLTLSDLRCGQVQESNYPLIQLRRGASGSASEPIVISHCELECGPQGLCLWLHAPEKLTIKHVRIEGNRLTGNSTQILLWGTMEDIEISQNLLLDPFNGINVEFERPNSVNGIRVINNTFFGENFWLGLVHSTLEQGTIEFRNNLILGSRQIELLAQDLNTLAESWTFRHNLWERGPMTLTDAGLDGRIADVVDTVPLVSRDPVSPDFLRPATDAVVRPSDPSSDILSYIGAKPPQTE